MQFALALLAAAGLAPSVAGSSAQTVVPDPQRPGIDATPGITLALGRGVEQQGWRRARSPASPASRPASAWLAAALSARDRSSRSGVPPSASRTTLRWLRPRSAALRDPRTPSTRRRGRRQRRSTPAIPPQSSSAPRVPPTPARSGPALQEIRPQAATATSIRLSICVARGACLPAIRGARPVRISPFRPVRSRCLPRQWGYRPSCPAVRSGRGSCLPPLGSSCWRLKHDESAQSDNLPLRCHRRQGRGPAKVHAPAASSTAAEPAGPWLAGQARPGAPMRGDRALRWRQTTPYRTTMAQCITKVAAISIARRRM